MNDLKGFGALIYFLFCLFIASNCFIRWAWAFSRMWWGFFSMKYQNSHPMVHIIFDMKLIIKSIHLTLRSWMVPIQRIKLSKQMCDFVHHHWFRPKNNWKSNSIDWIRLFQRLFVVRIVYCAIKSPHRYYVGSFQFSLLNNYILIIAK